jgi:hypothetical protein
MQLQQGLVTDPTKHFSRRNNELIQSATSRILEGGTLHIFFYNAANTARTDIHTMLEPSSRIVEIVQPLAFAATEVID